MKLKRADWFSGKVRDNFGDTWRYLYESANSYDVNKYRAKILLKMPIYGVGKLDLIASTHPFYLVTGTVDET